MPAQRIDYPKYEYIPQEYQSRYGDTIASMLGRQGQQRAALELQRGQASADLWRGVGQSISNAATGYMESRDRNRELARREAIDKQDAAAKALALKNAQMQSAELERTVQGQDFSRQAMGMALRRNDNGIATYDRDTLSQAFAGSPYADQLPKIFQSLDEADAASQKVLSGRKEAIAAMAYGVIKAGNSPVAFELGANYLIENGLASEQELGPYRQKAKDNPEMIPELTQSLASSVPKYADLLKPKLDKAGPGDVVYNAETGATVLSVPDEPKPVVNPTEAALALRAASGDQEAVEALRLLRAQRPPAAGAGGSNPQARQALVDAVIANPAIYDDLTPTSREGIAADLASRGFTQFGSQTTTKPSTGVQKRAFGYFQRAQQADETIEGLEDSIAKMNLSGQAWMAFAPNFAQTQEGQSYTAAQRAFTEARLRKDSGAAIPTHEYDNDRKTYFAQPGDSSQTLAEKRRGRASILASLAFESGTALNEFYADEAPGLIQTYRDRSKKPDAGAPPPPPGARVPPPPGTAAGTVHMRTADGRDIYPPANQVEEAKRRGAKVVP